MRSAGNGPVAGVGAAGAVREIPMFTSLTEGTGRQEGGRRLGNREAPACGPIDCCLRRSCGDVTMVFVFVAAVSHSSYKSKNFMPGGRNPIPSALCQTHVIVEPSGNWGNVQMHRADADGAVVARVFHDGTVAVGATFLQWAGGRDGGRDGGSRGRAGACISQDWRRAPVGRRVAGTAEGLLGIELIENRA